MSKMALCLDHESTPTKTITYLYLQSIHPVAFTRPTAGMAYQDLGYSMLVLSVIQIHVDKGMETDPDCIDQPGNCDYSLIKDFLNSMGLSMLGKPKT